MFTQYIYFKMYYLVELKYVILRQMNSTTDAVFSE